MNERWPVRAGDGHELDVYAERPDDARAALLFVPAMGVEARYYAHFAEALSREGVLFAVCDLRGHGTSSLRPGRNVDFGYREIVERDLPAVMEVVRDQTEGLPLYVGGHSLGGQLMMLHLAATRPDITGMVLVACAIPYYRNWQGLSRGWIRLATVLFPAAGFILGYVPGDRLGLGGKEARTLMRDWAHNAATARYEPIGSDVDYEAALATLGVDLVTINIDGDEMAPPNAVDFMFDKVPHARGVRVEARLSKPKRGAHVRWARDSAEVVQAISRWLEARATA
jgi:predicted alpha/beta hydrolase